MVKSSNQKRSSYELLVMSGGKWQTHNVYTSDNKDVCIEDAKSMQNLSTTEAIKMVRKFFDNSINGYQTRIIYQHPKSVSTPAPVTNPTAATAPAPAAKAAPKAKKRVAKPNKKKKKKLADAPQDDNPDVATSPEAVESPAPQSSVPKIFGTGIISSSKIIMQTVYSLFISLGAAFMVSYVASYMLKDSAHFPVLSREKIHIIVFIFLFILFSALLAARIIYNSYVLKLVKKAKAENERENPSTYDLDLSLPSEAIEEMKLFRELSLDGVDQIEDDEVEDGEGEAENEAEDEKPSLEDLANEILQLPAEVKSSIESIKNFIDQSLHGLEDELSDIDSYSTFGISLYMVGAVQALCQERHIDKEYLDKVLSESMLQIGMEQDRINHMIERSDEYLISDPRYTQMYQVGRSAMGIWLDSGIGAAEAFALSFENWIKPWPKPSAAPPVVVLFTDIAGSTAMTQERGDELAQEIVRDHNRIVREAISINQGREIKHTGDGIMASFSNGINGVEAAIEMQKMVKQLVDSNPDNPLALKIGINVGEPISEENDLFGATVQLAARIVDKAQSGEILISEAMHGLMSGKKISLEKSDEFEMKGFDQPIATYRVIWIDA